ncbi:S66 family peptidase [Tepidibacillus fermentans]|uniref:Muramoyltetrapeptide carboxypeptidase LdcA involved in peptidoglycan recycling n=1 Tax=Tepidibacillus fermentans TaxID=1281767 RepID=A0A4R3KCR7_9BACI|nr:S66 peptidase family protein [Tepidibacillus fermentans]TCS81026.1 muramoyltetrapeptide carboxypeptidase LdcA involved in peptidoglycan recycling [Tepidibacillus fermentans]
MIPNKLKRGDEIRVVSPSRSLSVVNQANQKIAIDRLESLGFHVTFGDHCYESDEFHSSSIESRIEDLHNAFSDPNVKAILTSIGGYNSNQILKYLDYSLIQANPKILCGYSDITALGNAIYTKTGLTTYSGPHFSTFGILKGMDYTIDYFQKALMTDEIIEVKPSDFWSDDPWYLDQENRTFIENNGWYVINEGKAEGVIIGGNLCTLNLLQGTEFMPSLKNTILFIEDDELTFPENFDRDLQSLIHQKGFEEVRGIVIGRFQKKSEMSREILKKIIKSKKELDTIPVIADVDFGHTYPQITFPIGGKVSIVAKGNESKIKILQH